MNGNEWLLKVYGVVQVLHSLLDSDQVWNCHQYFDVVGKTKSYPEIMHLIHGELFGLHLTVSILHQEG